MKLPANWYRDLWLVAITVIVLLALRDQHNFSLRNCKNLQGIAGIERTFIQQQQQQTKSLLEHGVTFGIPKKDLPGLIEQSEATQQAFLEAFDALSLTNC